MPRHCVLPSPLTAITRTVTVAGGRFAPGHLGELTAVVPFELVDAVLAETRTVQQRLRDLPSRVGVVSVRYLHRLFEGEGTTVSRRIRELRLQECRRELTATAARRTGVGSVARR